MSSTDTPRAPWAAYQAADWGNASADHRGRQNDSLGNNIAGIWRNSCALLRRAEAWLDDRGRGAWIAAAILSFIFFWPAGLAITAYMIWSKRMFSKSARNARSARPAFTMSRSSGNSAFDAYREDTLRRLEEEQRAFESFLIRLRDAKDKAEFDQFMEDRARRAPTAPKAEDEIAPAN